MTAESREVVATTVDGERLYAGDTYECAYCNAELPAECYDARVPDADDDDAWAKLAQQHSPDCEWVETRAHRRQEGANA